MKKYSLFIFGLIFCGCYLNDDLKQLSGGYVYVEYEGRRNQIRSLNSRKKSIYSYIVDYKYNENYILILQQPDRREYRAYIVDSIVHIDTNISHRTNFDNVILQADSIMLIDSFYNKLFNNKYNYWIISHRDGILNGPFNKEDYLQKRKELNVPLQLKLKDE